MDLATYCDAKHGRQTELARALAVPSQLVWQWARRVREVPVQRCAAIEAATSGAVTRRDLRPLDWHLIWPELVTAEFPAPQPRAVEQVANAA
jgi:DNA-binding transcriptional regulator YdaS (Cro superfamily)